MDSKTKGILINAIINSLNECVKAKNKILVSQNLHQQQKPLHGADMFFKLAYMSDENIKKIAKECGI